MSSNLEIAMNEGYKQAGENAYFGTGFKMGAEYMKKEYEEKLRWIPVEEKEPPKDLILMKLSNGEIRLGHFFSKMSTSSGIFVNVTHFRHLFL